MTTKEKITTVVDSLAKVLITKNKDYGDSATEGSPIFATDKNKDSMDAKQFGLCCRIDDKLHRIQNGGITPRTLDSVWDLAGYLILLLISLNSLNNEKAIDEITDKKTE